MFFLIRCAFWLTIVFHAMSWPSDSQLLETGPQAPSSRASGTQGAVLKMASDFAGELASAAGTAVTAKLEEGCLKAPAECMALAARLPQIVATNQVSQRIDVLPPKRPLQLAEGETARSTTHKALTQHN